MSFDGKTNNYIAIKTHNSITYAIPSNHIAYGYLFFEKTYAFLKNYVFGVKRFCSDGDDIGNGPNKGTQNLLKINFCFVLKQKHWVFFTVSLSEWGGGIMLYLGRSINRKITNLYRLTREIRANKYFGSIFSKEYFLKSPFTLV